MDHRGRLRGRSRTRNAIAAALVLAGSIARASPAQAGPEESLRAESLFRSGRDAYQRGDFATGCPRLAESQRLEPAGGTLLTLALCYEAWGKNATAWALFQQAEAVARAQGRSDRMAIARQRAQALEPDLSFITVELAPDTPPSVEVVLDDLRLGGASLKMPTAVDAGAHRVEALHGGVAYFAHALELGAKESVVVTIPAPPAPTPPPETVEAPAEKSRAPASNSRPTSPESRARTAPPSAHTATKRPGPQRLFSRVLPLGVLGAGAASLLAGSYFGLRAYQQNREVEAGCPRHPCSPSLQETHQSALRNATRANWLVGGGAIATAGALSWLFGLVSRPDNKATSSLAVEVSRGQVAASVSGGF
jgi:hypothetical protein